MRRRETISLGQSAIILPFYKPLRSFQLTRSAPNLTRGTALAFHTIGMNGEYVGSREYQPGIPVRKWDYPSWARLGQPVVREYCDPRYPSAAVVLDTHFDTADPPAADPIPELEAILSLAAAITDSLLAPDMELNCWSLATSCFSLTAPQPMGTTGQFSSTWRWPSQRMPIHLHRSLIRSNNCPLRGI